MVDVGAGFTGSAGIALVLDKDAALWTDSRYFYQVYGSYQILLPGTVYGSYQILLPGLWFIPD